MAVHDKTKMIRRNQSDSPSNALVADSSSSPTGFDSKNNYSKKFDGEDPEDAALKGNPRPFRKRKLLAKILIAAFIMVALASSTLFYDVHEVHVQVGSYNIKIPHEVLNPLEGVSLGGMLGEEEEDDDEEEGESNEAAEAELEQYEAALSQDRQSNTASYVAKQTTPQVKPEIKETKPEPKPEIKPDPKPEIKPTTPAIQEQPNKRGRGRGKNNQPPANTIQTTEAPKIPEPEIKEITPAVQEQPKRKGRGGRGRNNQSPTDKIQTTEAPKEPAIPEPSNNLRGSDPQKTEDIVSAIPPQTTAAPVVNDRKKRNKITSSSAIPETVMRTELPPSTTTTTTTTTTSKTDTTVDTLSNVNNKKNRGGTTATPAVTADGGPTSQEGNFQAEVAKAKMEQQTSNTESGVNSAITTTEAQEDIDHTEEWAALQNSEMNDEWWASMSQETKDFYTGLKNDKQRTTWRKTNIKTKPIPDEMTEEWWASMSQENKDMYMSFKKDNKRQIWRKQNIKMKPVPTPPPTPAPTTEVQYYEMTEEWLASMSQETKDLYEGLKNNKQKSAWRKKNIETKPEPSLPPTPVPRPWETMQDVKISGASTTETASTPPQVPPEAAEAPEPVADKKGEEGEKDNAAAEASTAPETTSKETSTTAETPELTTAESQQDADFTEDWAAVQEPEMTEEWLASLSQQMRDEYNSIGKNKAKKYWMKQNIKTKPIPDEMTEEWWATLSQEKKDMYMSFKKDNKRQIWRKQNIKTKPVPKPPTPPPTPAPTTEAQYYEMTDEWLASLSQEKRDEYNSLGKNKAKNYWRKQNINTKPVPTLPPAPAGRPWETMHEVKIPGASTTQTAATPPLVPAEAAAPEPVADNKGEEGEKDNAAAEASTAPETTSEQTSTTAETPELTTSQQDADFTEDWAAVQEPEMTEEWLASLSQQMRDEYNSIGKNKAKKYWMKQNIKTKPIPDEMTEEWWATLSQEKKDEYMSYIKEKQRQIWRKRNIKTKPVPQPPTPPPTPAPTTEEHYYEMTDEWLASLSQEKRDEYNSLGKNKAKNYWRKKNIETKPLPTLPPRPVQRAWEEVKLPPVFLKKPEANSDAAGLTTDAAPEPTEAPGGRKGKKWFKKTEQNTKADEVTPQLTPEAAEPVTDEEGEEGAGTTNKDPSIAAETPELTTEAQQDVDHTEDWAARQDTDMTDEWWESMSQEAKDYYEAMKKGKQKAAWRKINIKTKPIPDEMTEEWWASLSQENKDKYMGFRKEGQRLNWRKQNIKTKPVPTTPPTPAPTTTEQYYEMTDEWLASMSQETKDLYEGLKNNKQKSTWRKKNIDTKPEPTLPPTPEPRAWEKRGGTQEKQ